MDTSVSQNIRDGKYKNSLPYGPGAESRAAYRQEEAKIMKLFWDDIREEFDLDPSNPKHERMLGIAWDHGHSSGFHEVYTWIEELWELVK